MFSPQRVAIFQPTYHEVLAESANSGVTHLFRAIRSMDSLPCSLRDSPDGGRASNQPSAVSISLGLSAMGVASAAPRFAGVGIRDPMRRQRLKEADQMPTCLWHPKTSEEDVALFLSVVEDRALIPPLSAICFATCHFHRLQYVHFWKKRMRQKEHADAADKAPGAQSSGRRKPTENE